MLKTIVLIKRRPDLPYADFLAYWREHHTPLVANLPGMLRNVQNHIEPEFLPSLGQFDGVAESWWTDAAALQAVRKSPELRAMRADEPNFIDVSATQTLVVRERETFRVTSLPG